MEADDNVGNKVVLGSKGSNLPTHPLSASTSANLIYMDEYDSFVATLNIVGSLYCCGLFITYQGFASGVNCQIFSISVWWMYFV